ncbi:hypothetical protein [Neobacillus niacini]
MKNHIDSIETGFMLKVFEEKFIFLKAFLQADGAKKQQHIDIAKK